MEGALIREQSVLWANISRVVFYVVCVYCMQISHYQRTNNYCACGKSAVESVNACACIARSAYNEKH